MVARSCAAPRISGEYESVTTESFNASMIALQKSRSFEFAIGGKSMTNLDRNGPAKNWMWSGGPLQTRPYDLDGRQTSYPYTSSGTPAKTYGYDGPRPPGELDRLASYSNEVYAYDGPRPVASLPGGLGPGLPRADSNRSSHTVHTSGALITETIYLNDTPIAAIKAAGAYLIQADHLNTPRAMLAASNGASPPYPSGSWHAQIPKNKSRALLRFLKLPSRSQIELNQ